MIPKVQNKKSSHHYSLIPIPRTNVQLTHLLHTYTSSPETASYPLRRPRISIIRGLSYISA